jgi:hypothetical protein
MDAVTVIRGAGFDRGTYLDFLVVRRLRPPLPFAAEKKHSTTKMMNPTSVPLNVSPMPQQADLLPL